VANFRASPHHDLVPQDLNAIAWPVRTDRLVLRPATVDDMESTWQIRRLPAVSQWMTSGADDREVFAATFAQPDRLAKILVVELDGRQIGDLMVSVEDAWAQTEVADQARGVQAELGWVIDPACAGNGFATEAASALLRICFVELGLRRVYAQCFADNAASWRIMEKLGMRREEYAVRDSLHRSGQWMDGMRYAILSDEWRARPAGAGSA
jgi:RimJ/RimL family protein N-acetyltransferase